MTRSAADIRMFGRLAAQAVENAVHCYRRARALADVHGRERLTALQTAARDHASAAEFLQEAVTRLRQLTAQLAQNRKLELRADEIAGYREPARAVVPPAPYMSPFANCPLCGANPGLLFPHLATCEWLQAYEAADRRMAEGTGPWFHNRAWRNMSADDYAAVWALRPKPPSPPTWWARAKLAVRRVVVAVLRWAWRP